MDSRTYWAQRALARMDSYHKDNDRVVGKVLEAYQAAIKDIDADIERILGAYAKNGSLTREEALQKLTNLEARQTLDSLEKSISGVKDAKLRQELLSRINAPAYRARLTRLEAVKEKLNIEVQRVANVTVREMDKGLFSTAETAFYSATYDMQRRTGRGYSFAEIPTKQIQEVLRNNWSGKHYSDRVWGNAAATASNMEHILTKGLMQGKSVRKMADEMAETMNSGKYAATRLIRTETTYVSNAAELKAYEEAGVEKIEYLAQLDGRTSEMCRELDGKLIPVKRAVIGKNVPPVHPNCRSTTLEIFDDDNLADLKRRARDPKTGELIEVPLNMSYKQWEKKFVG